MTQFIHRLLPFLFTLALVAALPAQQTKKKPPPKKNSRAALLAIPDVPRDELVCFALYTVHANTVKMTAQFYPLLDGEARKCWLEVQLGGTWKKVAEADIVERGWTALLRVDDWDDTQTAKYRVRHDKGTAYEGTLRKNPVDKETFVMAGFTGNSIYPGHGGTIPKDDIIANINKIDPDLLFFSGDQVYDHRNHYPYWLRFGREFGPIIKDRPTITIPDDHDVGQANIWGHGGRKSNTGAGNDGGYFMPVEYVKEVERAQTSHLPDPFDPTPIQRGIGVYYTHLNWGRVSMAILEDRKFKTGPKGIIPQQGPRPDHIRNPDYDPREVDVPEARLLGDRQLKFLEAWGQDWAGADMKAVLSQTIFCGGAHIHGKVGGRLHADLDSNGWPQTGRNKAIAKIRKAFAFHFAGDQHLATIFHHGINEFRDGCYSFCVPSIANLYLRWWKPLEPGGNRAPGQDPIFGDHLDGFHNKLTAIAAANPSPERGGDVLSTRAAGFGVVRIHKPTRKVTFECYKRNVDVDDEDALYEGWPFTFHQLDNYGRDAQAHLPTLEINKPDQVVQVINEFTGEVVYTLRIQGKSFRPKVFATGTYAVKVGEGDSVKLIEGVQSLPESKSGTLEVKLP